MEALALLLLGQRRLGGVGVLGGGDGGPGGDQEAGQDGQVSGQDHRGNISKAMAFS